MRRTLSTIIACSAALAITTTGAAAQTIGFKLGAGFANMADDRAGVTTDGITGFAGGGHIRFGGRIGLQAELLSVTKGANFSGPGGASYDMRFEYVEIPVVAHIPLTLGNVAPYVFGGGAVGLQVRCRITPTGGTSTQQRDCPDQGVGTFDPQTTDFSLLGGAGIAIGMGPGSVIVEGRYTVGMRNIDRTTTDRNLRHRVATIMAGYEIPLVRGW
jgi:hypothetical protein